jgi:two-component system chemotaxis response regulator CheB
MLVIKQYGGAAMVQDPQVAEVPDMVRSALDCVEIDHVLPVDKISDCLVRLTREAPAMSAISAKPTDNDGEQPSGLPDRPASGALAPMVCPECGGSLWESQHGVLLRYECHEGHAYSAESLLCDQREAVEAALWAAVRTLDENAEMYRRMAQKAAQRNHRETANVLADQARTQAERATLIRKVISLEPLSKSGPQTAAPEARRA